MNNFLPMLSEPNLVCLGWALVHFLWQGTLTAAVLEIALAFVRRRNASLRYLFCAVALGAMPVCLFATYADLVQKSHAPIAPPVSADASVSNPAALSGMTPQVDLAPTSGTVDGLTLRGVPSLELNRFMPAVVGVWLLGVALLTARKAGGFYIVWRLRGRGVSVPGDAVVELFRSACARIGVDPRRVRLKISELVRVPMTMGWIRPIVLFPAALLSGLSTGEIELLLAHELAHIRRCDYLVNLVQTVVETLFFYHPVTWWISRRMRQERENCCDDLVAEASGGRLDYAKVLLRLETMRSPGAALALAASGGALRQRIERLIGEPRVVSDSGLPALLALLSILGVIVSLSMARAQDPVLKNAVSVVSGVTVTETKELVGDVGRLYHAMVYTQTSAAAPKLGPASYQFIADMANNAFPVTGGTVSLPVGSGWATNPVAVVKPDLLVGAHYLFVQGFDSEAGLLASFPNGSYVFNIQPGATGAAAYTAPVSFTGAVSYPPIAPVITNTTWESGNLILDPTSAVITFTNYPGATLTWEIVIPGKTYIMSAGGGGTSVGSLNLTGMLSYGQTYQAQLRFINRDKSSTVSDPTAPKDYGYATMVARIVEFTIKTPAGHASAPAGENLKGVAAGATVVVTAGKLLPADSPIQQRYVADEVKRLTARLELSPKQVDALHASMEAGVHERATKSVEQTLKEMLSPKQWAAWEQYKQDSVRKDAMLMAEGKSFAIAQAASLSAEKRRRTFDALLEVELKYPSESFHGMDELSAYLDRELAAEEAALAAILTPAQVLMYDQQQKAQFQQMNVGTGMPSQSLVATDLTIAKPPEFNAYTPPPLNLDQLPKTDLQYRAPKQ
jgi:beta-lactamase regulating signal transducer with metallopeptidase domain